MRDKLSKGSVGSSSGAGDDSRPGSTAGPQRPKLARKPLPGFAGARALASAAGEVQVFVAERPATASRAHGGAEASSGSGSGGGVAVSAPSRPWSAQPSHGGETSTTGVPAAGAGYGVVTVHAHAPPGGQALSSSMPAPLPKPRASLGGAALAALAPGGPPPRAPSAPGTDRKSVV